MGSSSVIIGPEGAAALAGLLLGLGSLVSIGPNNLLLLREGLTGGRVGIVTGVVLGTSLLFLLVADAAADLLCAVPAGFQIALTWLGLVALATFAVRAAIASRRPAADLSLFCQRKEPTALCVRRAAMVVWLNPLSYLERLIVPATICQTYATPSLRAAFIAALMIMAAINAAVYVLGGRLIVTIARGPRSLRLFDVASAVILSSATAALGCKLVLSAP